MNNHRPEEVTEMTTTTTLIGQDGYGVTFDPETLTLTCGICGETHTLRTAWYADAAAARIANTHRASHELLDPNGGPDWGQTYDWEG